MVVGDGGEAGGAGDAKGGNRGRRRWPEEEAVDTKEDEGGGRR